jgi:cell division control protein 6
MKYLMADQTLFRDPDVFETDYLPDQFSFRESQLRELAYSLRLGLRGSRPVNTLLRGLPGTGKTTSVQRIFAEVEETTRRLVPVYVNCQNELSRYTVFSRIHRKLFGTLPPPTGVSFRHVFDKICREIISREIVLIVCFDDANYLLRDKILNDTLFTLLRLHEEHRGARAGVFLTMSNIDMDLSKELDPCVVSVLQPHEIYFPPYTAEEIQDILGQRINQGLYPGVLSEEMRDLVLQYTMQSGDLRVGINLIRESVNNAECAARCEVTPEDISAAYDVARDAHLSACVRALSQEERMTLGHIAELSRGTSPYMTSGAVYGIVKESLGIGYTVYFEHLKKLDEMRLITLTQGRVRGNTREIALRYDSDRVVEACGFGK